MTSESAYVSAWLETVTTHLNLLVQEMDMLVQSNRDETWGTSIQIQMRSLE